ncbi:MAG: hypothetical protein JWO69_1421 [Thermoleophilia bacterium]|jgi:hypothetical protein|nr:hypothetical protein [Thermoleophilia bacterium]
MCGCSPLGSSTGAYASGAAAPVSAPNWNANATQAAAFVPLSPYVSSQLPTQANVNDGRVRNETLAQQTLQRLKSATQGISTPAQAAAAGYKPNPSAPDHWINDSVFAARNGYDLARPATLMFEGEQLLGVMLSHDPRQGLPPDLGAGSWHTHGGTAGAEYASHIWFNKPLQSAFGTETGDV